MSEETTTTEEEQNDESWFIDLNWYGANNRSFSVIAGKCLCDKCRKKLKADTEEVAAKKLIDAISGCCSEQPEYITGEMPVLESVFRIMLAGGNKPLKMQELVERLIERRGSVPGGSSGEMLVRLLRKDRFYGLSSHEK